MTIEQLKAEAEAMGYVIALYKREEKFEPCVCGHNRRDHLSVRKDHYGYVKLVCKKCGRDAVGIDELDAKRNWNQKMRQLKELDCPWK